MKALDPVRLVVLLLLGLFNCLLALLCLVDRLFDVHLDSLRFLGLLSLLAMF